MSVQPDELGSTRGIRHTSPARTWCDLASVLSLYDLVAVGDYLIQWRLPMTTTAELSELSRRFIARRGMAHIKRALPLLSDRAESRPESQLRVMLLEMGLPRPRVNHEIVYTEDGVVMRTDFAFVQYRVILEYQGDYHRKEKGQWRRDMTRRSRLEALGWYVMELNADDLRNPIELASRIRSVLRPRGWRG